MTNEIVPVELETRAVLAVTNVERFEIITEVHYREAGEFLKRVKGLIKEIDETFSPVEKKAKEALAAVKAARDKHRDPLTAAERSLKEKMAEWSAEQERNAREERERIEAEARKQAEDERLSRAARLEDAGRVAEANALLEAPVPKVEVEEREVAKVAGVSYRTDYSAEVEDVTKLVRWALDAEAIVPGTIAQVLMPNGPGLNAMARQQKEMMNVPGVRLVVKRTTSVRA